ncbi:hypothetical protein GGQ11_003218 [Salinibacter ruber]|uniref:Uncharacterized protein n=1 Tax=Salinibacter ruber TaxID=146919 RepID=A0A9X2ZTN3_9BACT|nr:hypothetical protein [Salinibacter ruber]MCS3658413.1 hypothetical protein [Salinibacter ruber]MCS3953271.1 hypothetical protein [Salinibacter ruber]MCS4119509.1 hypothetical protein [Salinibacter ruber]MCS4155784.1 hypothetical protein [Salinibacter ruber]MCS4171937.1 hypothetical protein [Salinibacter ruber]
MLTPTTRTPPSFPDFIIGGAMKSATSSLHHLLSNHEQVYLPDGETHFFCMDDPVQHSGFFFPARAPSQRAPDHDRHGETNLDWYRQLFEPAHPDQCAGDYSSTYLPAPELPSASSACSRTSSSSSCYEIRWTERTRTTGTV